MTTDQAALLANKLKAELTRLEWPESQLADITLQRVVQHIGLTRVDVAIDALTLYPRPLWLAAIAGSYPYNIDSDLADLQGIADIDDWGNGGIAPI